MGDDRRKPASRCRRRTTLQPAAGLVAGAEGKQGLPGGHVRRRWRVSEDKRTVTSARMRYTPLPRRISLVLHFAKVGPFFHDMAIRQSADTVCARRAFADFTFAPALDAEHRGWIRKRRGRVRSKCQRHKKDNCGKSHVEVLPGEERTRQRRVVPTHAPAGILHHIHRSMGWRKCVVEKLALARQHLGAGIEERARLDDNP